MSMFGSVTDAQVFSRELTDKEMMDITGCRWVAPSHFSKVSPTFVKTRLPGNPSRNIGVEYKPSNFSVEKHRAGGGEKAPPR